MYSHRWKEEAEEERGGDIMDATRQTEGAFSNLYPDLELNESYNFKNYSQLFPV